jgi:hypothetical protein
MAVTQQLARLSPDLLQRCRADVTVLGDLVSFLLVPEQNYLDLHWAPAPLEKIVGNAGDAEGAAALRLACQGARPVNDGFPDFEVYEPPRELDIGEVRATSAALARIAFDGIARDASGYTAAQLGEYLRALCAFYAAAAAANEAVIVWWD